MPNKNIVLIQSRAFSKRDYGRLGIKELSAYFTVWVFDCSTINDRSLIVSSIQTGRVGKEPLYDGHVFIRSLKDLEYHLSQTPMSLYVDLLAGMNFANLAIRKMLNKHNTIRTKLCISELPSYGKPQRFLAKLNNAFKRGEFVRKFARYVFVSHIVKYLEPKVDLAIFSGEVCLKRYPKLTQDVIWTHSIDYQIYLDSLGLENEVEDDKEYALFLDQNAPTHPDYAFHGNKPPVTKGCYYKALNNFFNDFEETTGIEVIIAGHPRSSPDLAENWPGKKFVLGKTPQLVKGAKLVFAHYSTAISFPVLWRKPIIQLTTDEYMNSYRKDRFEAFAGILKLPVLNADRYDLSQLRNCTKMEIEKSQRDMYKQFELDYLRSRYTEGENMWDIVAEKLNCTMKNVA